ncbi:Response regulator [Desulfarculales bacterium]
MPLTAHSVLLVVDDPRTMRTFLGQTVHDLGYKQILATEDGYHALTMLKQHYVAFIICDWSMPKMSGLKLLKQVCGDPTTAGLPFVMVATAADKDPVMQAIQAGVSNHIVKSFNMEILVSKISQVETKHE